MKRFIILGCLVLVSFLKLNGQWYNEEYGVQSIEMLSDSQLSISLRDSNKNFYVSGFIAVFGGAMTIWVSKTHPGMSEDPGIIEQIIGDKGMDVILTGVGLGLAAGGLIASIVYSGRSITIKSLMRSRRIYAGTLNIAPIIISDSYSNLSSPGIRFTFSF